MRSVRRRAPPGYRTQPYLACLPEAVSKAWTRDLSNYFTSYSKAPLPIRNADMEHKLGLSTINYGRAVYECIHGTWLNKDDENMNSPSPRDQTSIQQYERQLIGIDADEAKHFIPFRKSPKCSIATRKRLFNQSSRTKMFQSQNHLHQLLDKHKMLRCHCTARA